MKISQVGHYELEYSCFFVSDISICSVFHHKKPRPLLIVNSAKLVTPGVLITNHAEPGITGIKCAAHHHDQTCKHDKRNRLDIKYFQGRARFPEFYQNFSERQILWSLCLVVFHALTLKLPIQTLLSVVPELPVSLCSGEKSEQFMKTSTAQCFLY